MELFIFFILGTITGTCFSGILYYTQDSAKVHRDAVKYYKAYLKDCWNEIEKLREEKDANSNDTPT